MPPYYISDYKISGYKFGLTDRDLLLPRLELLAVVLDALMPGCADLVRETIELLIKQEDLEIKLESAVELIHKKNEQITKLEEQIKTLTR